ncbi:MAG: PD-(D/E)XK nuclease family protein, partial [Ignavibacteriales bacterium]|nr:PD-(D/E)XK nuclease family protein [Ignavibacteriales bacterium]
MILSKQKLEKIDIRLVINELISNGKLEQILFIVPTNRKARKLKKELIDSSPGKITSRLYIETLTTLSQKLLEQFADFVFLSEAESSVFINQAASEVKLNYFNIYKKEIPYGTLEKIRNVITEYKRIGITPEKLSEEAVKLERAEKRKAEDISSIYEKYRKKCEKVNAFEVGDIYEKLNKQKNSDFVDKFINVFRNIKLVIVTGFDEFTNPEVQIINSISNIHNIQLFIDFDYYKNNPLIFSHLDKTFDRLASCRFNKIEDTSKRNQNDFVKAIREKIFIQREKSYNGNLKDRITKIKAIDRCEEVELLAKQIKILIEEQKIKPSDICLVFNKINNYSHIVRDRFSMLGVPFNLTDRNTLDRSAPVIAVVQFLEIVENDFYHKNLFRSLSNGYINIEDIDILNLKNTAVKLNIIAGGKFWVERIGYAIEEEKIIDNENSERAIKSYKKALADIKKIILLAEPFKNELTIDEFVENLKKLIFNLNIPFRIIEVDDYAEANTKGLTLFMETVDELFQLLKDEYGKNKKHNNSFYLKEIRTACRWARFNVKEKSDYGVLVTSVNEIRGLNFDYLFIGGLIDGDFPLRYSPEIFFSGSYRKLEEQHQTEERFHFYQALCSWNKKLYLSAPQKEDKKELVESVFLKYLENLFDIDKIKSEKFKDKIFSKDELLIYAGSKIKYNNFNNAEFVQNYFDVASLKNKILHNDVRIKCPFNNSPYNGYILSENQMYLNEEQLKVINDLLEKHRASQFSVSQLEKYAQCPFKYFCDRVLKFKTVEEPSLEIEPVDIGNVLHSILFEFYTIVRDKNITIYNCDESTYAELKNILFKIAAGKLQKDIFSLPDSFLEKEKILGIAGNDTDSILYNFLEYEKITETLPPRYFEVSFGRLPREAEDKILTQSEPIIVNDISFRGKIDRVEVDEDNKIFSVVDYKTGSDISNTDIKNGLYLQLPFYMYIIKKILQNKFQTEYFYDKMFLYFIKYNKDEIKKKSKGTDSKSKGLTIENLIDMTLNFIKGYIDDIMNGIFPLTKKPEKAGCNYCDFSMICRLKEVELP